MHFLIQNVAAQVFNGPGLEAGVEIAGAISGPAKAPLRLVILEMLYTVLSFLTLAAIIMIVVAGLFLILSSGSEGAKDKAKKIILYVAIGLVVILLARVFVGFLLYGLLGP